MQAVFKRQIAGIHLHRACLFGTLSSAIAPYPWQSPAADLHEARRLIEQHGYWRLEDAEAILFDEGLCPARSVFRATRETSRPMPRRSANLPPPYGN